MLMKPDLQLKWGMVSGVDGGGGVDGGVGEWCWWTDAGDGEPELQLMQGTVSGGGDGGVAGDDARIGGSGNRGSWKWIPMEIVTSLVTWV